VVVAFATTGANGAADASPHRAAALGCKAIYGITLQMGRTVAQMGASRG
jgi:hypothetical protein